MIQHRNRMHLNKALQVVLLLSLKLISLVILTASFSGGFFYF